MSKPRSNLRLFVAAYPPLHLATAMLAALEACDLPPSRATPVEQVHLTIHFIGDMPVSELDATVESVQRAAAGLTAFDLTPMRLIALPERGPARLMAVELTGHPTLMEIHQRLVMRLARHAKPRHRQKFLPHITLARFRTPSRIDRDVDRDLRLPSFTVDRIVLMRSTLNASGATHHEVASCAL